MVLAVDLSDVGEAFARIATDGSLLLAVPVAVLAGLVSFLSPCMLPLVPGYLSYVTGLSGGDVAAAQQRLVTPGAGTAAASAAVELPRGRLLAGSSLFVLGFTAVFVSTGALFGGLGALLLAHAVTLQRVLGVLVILLGLGFVGVVPWLRKEVRWHHRPPGGLGSAPVLGALFGLGWTPCIGPTLAAVLALAANEASATRGAVLAAFYALGLGLPFIAVALGLRRALRSIALVRRHITVVTRAGGVLLVATGLLLVTGVWNALMVQIRVWVSGVTLPI